MKDVRTVVFEKCYVMSKCSGGLIKMHWGWKTAWQMSVFVSQHHRVVATIVQMVYPGVCVLNPPHAYKCRQNLKRKLWFFVLKGLLQDSTRDNWHHVSETTVLLDILSNLTHVFTYLKVIYSGIILKSLTDFVEEMKKPNCYSAPFQDYVN